MAGTRFAHGKKPCYIRLPPAVDGEAAVIVLRAQRDLKRLTGKVHAFVPVKFHGRSVHVAKTLDGRAEARTRPGQIIARLRLQFIIRKRAAHRVPAVIQIHPPPLAAFQIDQNVDDGASPRHLPHIERPLIPLQKQFAEHLGRCFKKVHQEFPLVRAVFRGGIDAGKHLHVGPRYVPPRLYRRQTILPLGQVFSFHPGLQRKACGPVMSGGIHTVSVHTGRASGSVYNVFALYQDETVCFLPRGGIQAEQAVRRMAVAEDADNLKMVQHRNTLGLHGLLQALGHLPAGVWAYAGGTPARVVICFVADVFSVTVARERNAQFHKLQKALGRKRSLAQSDIAVHTLP